jgi:hypothetical protein
MRNLTYVLLIGSALLHGMVAIAQDSPERPDSANRAVNITLGNSGGGLDDAALRSARKLVGKAIAANTVDTFVVYSPRVGGPIPIEGGLSACAEAGFNASSQKFNALIAFAINYPFPFFLFFFLLGFTTDGNPIAFHLHLDILFFYAWNFRAHCVRTIIFRHIDFDLRWGFHVHGKRTHSKTLEPVVDIVKRIKAGDFPEKR